MMESVSSPSNWKSMQRNKRLVKWGHHDVKALADGWYEAIGATCAQILGTDAWKGNTPVIHCVQAASDSLAAAYVWLKVVASLYPTKQPSCYMYADAFQYLNTLCNGKLFIGPPDVQVKLALRSGGALFKLYGYLRSMYRQTETSPDARIQELKALLEPTPVKATRAAAGYDDVSSSPLPPMAPIQSAPMAPLSPMALLPPMAPIADKLGDCDAESSVSSVSSSSDSSASDSSSCVSSVSSEASSSCSCSSPSSYASDLEDRAEPLAIVASAAWPSMEAAMGSGQVETNSNDAMSTSHGPPKTPGTIDEVERLLVGARMPATPFIRGGAKVKHETGGKAAKAGKKGKKGKKGNGAASFSRKKLRNKSSGASPAQNKISAPAPSAALAAALATVPVGGRALRSDLPPDAHPQLHRGRGKGSYTIESDNGAVVEVLLKGNAFMLKKLTGGAPYVGNSRVSMGEDVAASWDSVKATLGWDTPKQAAMAD
jgi:hypothetical protein